MCYLLSIELSDLSIKFLKKHTLKIIIMDKIIRKLEDLKSILINDLNTYFTWTYEP